ncbi:MAG TPA: hypothetical protein VNH18_32655 [Bryobacteraceae bacterium]|nr:hypothetical protein [Bryobacteraceae bacterium]
MTWLWQNNGAAFVTATAATAVTIWNKDSTGKVLELKSGPSGTVVFAVDGSGIITGAVDSITGTANQITASAATGAVTLSVPSDFRVSGSVTGGTMAAPPTGLSGYFACTSNADPRGLMTAQYSTDTVSARLHFRKSRGTEAVPTTIVTGDVLGRMRYSGYDGTAYLQMASIDAVSTGTIGTNQVPTKLQFYTATNANPSVLTLAMTLDETQAWVFPGGQSLVGTTADTTEIYRGTNAQSLNIWGRRVAAASGEYLQIAYDGTDFLIQPQAPGAGSSKALRLGYNGPWKITNAGNWTAQTDNTYDIGASGATRPRTGYFGTSVVVSGANAQSVTLQQATTQSGAMSGASTTLTNLIPAGSLVIGVTVHPTTAITSGDGATSYTVGDGTTANRWGTGIAFAANVTLANAVTLTPAIYPTATSVVLTATGGTFNAGVVRVTVSYFTIASSTS